MTTSPHNRPPTSIIRRRLLIAAGYAAVGGVALARLPRPATTSPGAPGQTTTTVPAKPKGAGLTEPPALAGAAEGAGADHRYGVVITNGRVIDPDSGFDGTIDVGIDGGTITGFGPSLPNTELTIDAKGHVVSPGFIDVLSYEPVTDGAWYKIADGVTTNLGMHGMQQGVWAEPFFAQYQGTTPVHFGGAFSDHWVRYQKLGLGVGATASPDQIAQLAETLEAELHDGWLGVDFEPEYTPGVDTAEIHALAAVAQRYGVPCFFHGRYSAHDEEAKTVPEIIAVAEQTGAAVHVAHLPSTGGTWNIERALDQIDQANDAGHDVTACTYPYDYWATYLGSARFGPGWQDRYQISYADLQVAGTSQRLSSATFGAAQAQNKLTVAYAIPERSVRAALEHPRVMIGSDAILDTGNNHPRATGCFARVLGHYVREEKVLSLVDALAKMTILPARRVQGASPAMARKGRIQVGADADVCIFDPDTISDRSTVADPEQRSSGISWVLVGGKIALAPDGPRTDQLAGMPIRSEL